MRRFGSRKGDKRSSFPVRLLYRFAVRRYGITGFFQLVLISVWLSTSCSIPNLEAPECDQARDVVREFYSFHFGNNLGFSEEDLNARRPYLTPEFLGSIRDRPDIAIDPFTREEDPPKAFRAGECKVIEAGTRTRFEVLLFWKDDARDLQRSIGVEMENRDGKWLIDTVSKVN